MIFAQPRHVTLVEELRHAPPKGTPFSVALPESEKPGRSKVYRAWNMQKELLTTIDPTVRAARLT
jgi:long-chain acyl-CoA synthetase